MGENEFLPHFYYLVFVFPILDLLVLRFHSLHSLS